MPDCGAARIVGRIGLPTWNAVRSSNTCVVTLVKIDTVSVLLTSTHAQAARTG